MNVILGVTGCIGAYKSVLVLRLLQQEGLEVFPVMTGSAREFIGAVTLEKLSGHRVVTDLFEESGSEIEHISLARKSDLLLVAPATANILAKFASGIADDFLSTLYLSTRTPVLVAPAMNVEMWRHPATRANLESLRARGVRIAEPGSGYQACGEHGEGRLAEPERIVRQAVKILGKRPGPLKGRRILVTAGPTVEEIDPIRFISNRSSGRMGYAVAEEAVRRGAKVDLITGPASLQPPAGVDLVRVRSAAEMNEAVLTRFDSSDLVVMAAAVADYRPLLRSEQKLKKAEGRLELELIRTEDILGNLGRRRRDQILIGFAAETENLVEHARGKLREKKLDLIVANDVGSSEWGMESEMNRVLFIGKEGVLEETPVLSKREIACRLWDQGQFLLEKRPLREAEGAEA